MGNWYDDAAFLVRSVDHPRGRNRALEELRDRAGHFRDAAPFNAHITARNAIHDWKIQAAADRAERKKREDERRRWLDYMDRAMRERLREERRLKEETDAIPAWLPEGMATLTALDGEERERYWRSIGPLKRAAVTAYCEQAQAVRVSTKP